MRDQEIAALITRVEAAQRDIDIALSLPHRGRPPRVVNGAIGHLYMHELTNDRLARLEEHLGIDPEATS